MHVCACVGLWDSECVCVLVSVCLSRTLARKYEPRKHARTHEHTRHLELSDRTHSRTRACVHVCACVGLWYSECVRACECL